MVTSFGATSMSALAHSSVVLVVVLQGTNSSGFWKSRIMARRRESGDDDDFLLPGCRAPPLALRLFMLPLVVRELESPPTAGSGVLGLAGSALDRIW